MTDFEIDKMIKIAGTDYDRRRKLSTKDIAHIRRAYKNGTSINDLALYYDVAYGTIRYHVDSLYRDIHNKVRNLNAKSIVDATAQRRSRVAYKRSILANNV